MAGTSLSEIYDLMLMKVTDYRLLDLFDTSQTDFENYLQAWLKFAIVDFSNTCNQDLTFDNTTKEFLVTLNLDNQVILATLMMKHWLSKDVNDVTQFRLHVGDRDFKTPSEAQNLREKSTYYNIVKEECSQMLIDYAYGKNDWASWFAQNFAGS